MAMAQATSGVFLNPRAFTETFWVSYAQFMQAAAKDLGLDLRVRYSERNRRYCACPEQWGEVAGRE
ncbi:Periplasmic sugar-binding domain protein [Pseudomonas orientalis]|nr:Periplasmic sugar-binding domain protein [Pseudomonas orientalis]